MKAALQSPAHCSRVNQDVGLSASLVEGLQSAGIMRLSLREKERGGQRGEGGGRERVGEKEQKTLWDKKKKKEYTEQTDRGKERGGGGGRKS